MTDRNDLVSAQEKLEWVTPKISLMDAGASRGKQDTGAEFSDGNGNKSSYFGPS
jgi:hypothetical protein